MNVIYHMLVWRDNFFSFHNRNMVLKRVMFREYKRRDEGFELRVVQHMLHFLQTLVLHLKLLRNVLIRDSKSIMERVFKPLEDPRHIILMKRVLPSLHWSRPSFLNDPRAFLRVKSAGVTGERIINH